MTEPVVLFEREEAYAIITLNRPASLNALIPESYAALDRALLCAADAAVRAVIVTGAGRGFCSGQDMNEPGSADPSSDLRFVDSTVRALRALEKPTIAAINGAAAGGGLAYALACDYRLMARDARLVPSFFDAGLVPDLGCSWFLGQMLGYARAIEWLCSGRRLAATEARDWGLVTEVVESADLMTRARALAKTLAGGPTLAIGLTKRLLHQASSRGFEAQLEVEAQAQSLAGASQDYREALAAYRERRAPRFTGR